MKYTNVYKKLASFGKELLDKTSLREGLPHISKYVKEVIEAQRCSIFINDMEEQKLWTTLSDGVEKIIIPSDQGLVGQTLKVKKPLIANEAYLNPYFSSKIDKQTGYITKNIITAPIFNSKREIIGVMELLNKKTDFNNEDVKFMIFFAHYISGFLELISLYSKEDKRKGVL